MLSSYIYIYILYTHDDVGVVWSGNTFNFSSEHSECKGVLTISGKRNAVQLDLCSLLITNLVFPLPENWNVCVCVEFFYL